MVAPNLTLNSAGNVLASQSLAAGAGLSVTVDASTKYEVELQISVTGGNNVAATNGVEVSIYRIVGGGSTPDTIPATQITVPTVPNATQIASLWLPTGKWKVRPLNLDTTNPVAALSLTSGSVDSVS